MKTKITSKGQVTAALLLLATWTALPAMATDADAPNTPYAPAAEEPAEARTEIVLLGTGTPFPDPERAGAAVMIRVDGEPYLVDAGTGVVRRAAAFFGRDDPGAIRSGVQQLRRVFVTHLHSDHTLGLADLMFTPWIIGSPEPLEVYGPPGIGAMVEHLRAAYAEDLEIRVRGLEQGNDTGHRAEVHEFEIGDEAGAEPRVVYRDERVTVKAFAVDHGSWEHAYGYRFDTPDRTIVISGDLAPSESVVKACDGCDVLVHEAYGVAGWERCPPGDQKYLREFHTSTHELAELATRARAKTVLLYHQLFFCDATEEEMVEEVRSGFGGEVISGRDLGVY